MNEDATWITTSYVYSTNTYIITITRNSGSARSATVTVKDGTTSYVYNIKQDVIKLVTVTFNVNTDNAVCPEKEKSVWEGFEIGALPTPSRTNCEFVGWFSTSATTGGHQIFDTTKIMKKQTLYARWKAIPDISTYSEEMLANFTADGLVTFYSVPNEEHVITLSDFIGSTYPFASELPWVSFENNKKGKGSDSAITSCKVWTDEYGIGKFKLINQDSIGWKGKSALIAKLTVTCTGKSGVLGSSVSQTVHMAGIISFAAIDYYSTQANAFSYPKFVAFDQDCTKVEVSVGSDWISAELHTVYSSSESGKKYTGVSVKVRDNYDYKAGRRGAIVVTCGGVKSTIQISQAGAPLYEMFEKLYPSFSQYHEILNMYDLLAEYNQQACLFKPVASDCLRLQGGEMFIAYSIGNTSAYEYDDYGNPCFEGSYENAHFSTVKLLLHRSNPEVLDYGDGGTTFNTSITIQEQVGVSSAFKDCMMQFELTNLRYAPYLITKAEKFATADINEKPSDPLSFTGSALSFSSSAIKFGKLIVAPHTAVMDITIFVFDTIGKVLSECKNGQNGGSVSSYSSLGVFSDQFFHDLDGSFAKNVVTGVRGTLDSNYALDNEGDWVGMSVSLLLPKICIPVIEDPAMVCSPNSSDSFRIDGSRDADVENTELQMEPVAPSYSGKFCFTLCFNNGNSEVKLCDYVIDMQSLQQISKTMR
ncbi:MAG: BACON domain-containing carbohydrate-binding protein [Oscillospiraceae bacterium]|nr:BACON domain-containing carbohydrate-binding protein [Oscillospiraceae bacterium]